MSPPNSVQLDRIFSNLDKNGDGFVSVDELMWLLERFNINVKQDEVEQLAGKTALDSIDFLFFYRSLVTKGNINDSINNDIVHEIEGEDEILESDLQEAFRVFDLNGDGFICCEELQIALSKLGLWDESYGQDCKHMIGFYDSNSDGLLDFDEFKDMMLPTFKT